MFSTIWKFINHWYFRYLLVTELYMVEKWERRMIHVIFFVIFTMIAMFNWTVVLALVSSMGQKFNMDSIAPFAPYDVVKNVYAIFS